MKKLSFYISLAVITLATSCTPDSGYTIKGDIARKEGTIYLSILEGKMPILTDSADISDGIFTFTGTLESPVIATLTLKGENRPFKTLFIENSKITLAGDIMFADEIAISGSSEQDVYEKEYFPISKNLDSVINFVAQNSNKVAAGYVLFRNLGYQLPAAQLDSLKSLLSPMVQNSSYIKMLDERIVAMKKSDIGCKYMEISLPNPQGDIISLSSVVNKGGYVLVDFWASWCPPCRKENPHLVNVYNQYKDRGFTVYGVSLDRPGQSEKWAEAIDKDKLDWYNVSDLKFWNCEPAIRYGVSSIPSSFLISPDGIIIAKNLRSSELSRKLEELLGIPSDDEEIEAEALNE